MEEIIYTTDCGMFRVVQSNGVFVPQMRMIGTTVFGRCRNMDEVAVRSKTPHVIQYGPWNYFYGTRCHDKSYKTLKGAIAFADRQSEALQAA